MKSDKKQTIWIDLDNAPHVPFFRPLINELQNRGYTTLITCRDYSDTIRLLKMYKMPYTEIGRHYGKNPINKIWGLVYRSLQLFFFVRSHHADIAVSHGSRSQLIASALLRMPMAMFFDYEGAKGIPFFDKLIHADKYIVPEALTDEILLPKFNDLSIFYKYPGIKEDVYLSQFTASPDALEGIELDNNKIIITLRPPASEAHYHNPLSDQIFTAILKRLSSEENTQTVLLPRTAEQKIIALELYANGKGALTIPDKVFNGLDLLWASDCVEMTTEN